MPLPKISTPTYELEIPSTGKKVKYRPFLVREEKILVMALESEDMGQITNAIIQILSDCISTRGVKVEELATFDIEYLFLNIRAKSVGEQIEVNVTCQDDGETQVQTEIDIDTIKVQKNKEHTNIIKLDDTLSMKLKYPTIDQFVEDIADTPIDILINNAGIFHEEQFEGLDPSIWLDEMKINALSPISLTHKLMKNLQAGSAKKVIFLSSQMGSIDDNYSGGYYFYRSSKAALNASAMSLSIDWKDQNIAVLMMHPGWVRTDMGTSKAKLSIEESVAGMLNVIDNFTINQTGAFLNYAGQKLEW